ncbi:MAG: hypothetical protein RR403_00255, partial [Pseudoflavonifractor sp.]
MNAKRIKTETTAKNRTPRLTRVLVSVVAMGLLLTSCTKPEVPQPKLSFEEWNGHPEIVQVNREKRRSTFVPYQSEQEALSFKKESSPYYKLLNGTWKFQWAADPGVKPKDFQAPGFDDSGWDDIQVPACWPALKNEDGSFRYDRPIYTNTTYPWYYTEPLAPGQGMMKNNSVGTYRTQFELDKDWAKREVFLNFEGVESAFYLWVNGKE